VNSVTLIIDDGDALRAFRDDHLVKGRAWVTGDHDVAERAQCELVIEHRGTSHRMRAEVVHVRREDPGRGIGLVLAPLSAEESLAVWLFVEAALPSASAATVEESSSEGLEEVPESPLLVDGEESEEPEESEQGEQGEQTGEAGSVRGVGESVPDRVRHLTGVEQLKLAAGGTLAERTALERLYGPTVWETLLRNARITLPEVARIARKASLPRPMVDLIAANKAWIASGEVQRALLSNPRSSPVVINKVLSMMPRHDLVLVPQQTAYPEPVRAAAKKRLGR
jgi:hypothetical protein